jgi:hypothetical protein
MGWARKGHFFFNVIGRFILTETFLMYIPRIVMTFKHFPIDLLYCLLAWDVFLLNQTVFEV